MRLKCISRYRSGFGSFEPGQDVDVRDDVAELLLRDSPGSFEAVPLHVLEPTPEPEPENEPAPEPDLSVMSEETETGLVVPDRRARGGKKRGQSVRRRSGGTPRRAATPGRGKVN